MAKASRLKIVVIGGGSTAWTPALVRDMLLTPSITNSDFILYDIDKKAADTAAAFCSQVARSFGSGAKIVSSNNKQQAFTGADYFIIAISTGGLDAMEHDIRIPEKFGIYHTVGDTSGPGGWSRLIRNFDVFANFAKDFNRLAPKAVVLNYTNPMVTLTDILARLCTGPVVGLCHGLFENLRFIKQFYKLENEDQCNVQYGGLNHFFWITEAQAGPTNVLTDLTRRLKTQGFTDLLRDSDPDAMGFKSNRDVATELFKLTGVMPYLGDRHTCEFFPWYITDKKKMAEYHIVRTTIAERRKQMRERAANLKKLVSSGDVPEYYKSRSRETAADIIDAHSQGKTFIDVGNLPNRGQVENLPRGLVVETAMRVDRNGFTPIAFGKLPETVLGLVEPYGHVYPMVVDACLAKNRKLALQALRLDPVCARLTNKEVEEMGNQLIAAHKKFVTVF